MSEPTPKGGLRAAWPWLLLAAALSLWAFESARPGADSVPAGELAPAVELASTDGAFNLGAERGRVVVMAFWATWCEACRAEGPVLSRVQSRIAAQGDRVVGVSVDELELDQIRTAADRLGMDYPIAKASPQVLERYGVSLLPTIYVIGPDGRIADSFTGMVSERSLLAAVEDARDRRLSAVD